jgi:hypothetical protein
MTHTELENLWEPALLTDAVSGTLRFGVRRQHYEMKRSQLLTRCDLAG